MADNIEKAGKEIVKEEKIVERKLKKWANNENILLVVIIILIAYLALIIMFPNVLSAFKFKTNEKVYSVEIIKITGCEKCMELTPVVSTIQEANVKIKNEKEVSYKADEAKKLIDKYSIKKIPAVIVLGKTEKIKLDENSYITEAIDGKFSFDLE